MARDETYRRLINSSRWRALRAAVLNEQPLCSRCAEAGLIRSACEVHHIVPVETAPTPRSKERLCYDRGNLTGLCHRCHVEVHRELMKGTKEETRRRNHAEARGFLARMFGPPEPEEPPED